MPLVPVLADMERVGIAVDLPYLAELGSELQGRIGSLEAEIYGHVGHEFNINSTQRLSDVLFGELHLEVDKRKRRSKTKTGHISTGSDVLEELRGTHPIIDLILEHRQLQKLKGTYVDALQLLVDPEHGPRPHVVQPDRAPRPAGSARATRTCRTSRSAPTSASACGGRSSPAPGALLLSADYSQIELRVLAHMANDPTLLEAFAQGEDPHAVTAAEVLGIPFEKVTSDHRRVAKMVNYGVLYGMSDYRPGRAHRPAVGGCVGLHPALLRAVRHGQGVPGQGDRQGRRRRLRRDAARPPALPPRGAQPPVRRAPGGDPADHQRARSRARPATSSRSR